MRAFLLVLGIVAAVAYAFYTDRIALPDRHNPWAQLQVDEPPGWLTRFKLGRVARDPGLCQRILATTDLRYDRVSDRDIAPGCGFHNAVRVASAGQADLPPTVLGCDSALSLALWERHVVQPAAAAQFGVPVARIEHYGSYACRNVGGRPEARRSRHAVADALDVAAFVLGDGRRIAVRTHWSTTGVEAAFLQALHAGACKVYEGVLGPGYDAAHQDHFHLERGGYRTCR